ncbi:prolipoprotein diacylglyceryl transferase [Haloimpatiens sp. FM7330]|uniref:prolipoprotein diacylglyceryl transferase n=1 Tax=Haloimpatiens sp. FM7330 TaxID=3298610 RepID=UPI00362A8808
MDPVAISIFGIDIRWYGILIAIGIVVAIFIAGYSCKVKGISYDKMLDLVIICLPIGILGARLYYVIFNWSDYNGNIRQMLNIRGGGLAIHGGVIASLCVAFIYTRIKKVSFMKYADAAVPSIILAQAIGRWGNFFNGEAHGGIVSYEFIKHFPEFIQKGMYINGTYYHPTFLYESVWNVIVFIILLNILKKCKVDGMTLFAYIGLYSLGRFFIEGLRTDSLMLGPLRMAQVVSLIGICMFLVFAIYKRKTK